MVPAAGDGTYTRTGTLDYGVGGERATVAERLSSLCTSIAKGRGVLVSFGNYLYEAWSAKQAAGLLKSASSVHLQVLSRDRRSESEKGKRFHCENGLETRWKKRQREG